MNEYIKDQTLLAPCFVRGDALNVLAHLPDGCIDCVVTSPPYYPGFSDLRDEVPINA